MPLVAFLLLAFFGVEALEAPPLRMSAALQKVGFQERALHQTLRDPTPWYEHLAPERGSVFADLGGPDKVVTKTNKIALVPPDCMAGADGYDLVVHFHGADVSLSPSLVESGLHAVMLIVNVGIGANAYSERFSYKKSFDTLLDAANQAVSEACDVAAPKPRRIALSAWSAGYGAVQRILREDPTRIDAVLLSDGLHAAFVNERARALSAPHMAPFLAFAKEAAAGKKLMAVTHSSIFTPRYASTTETASFLLSKLELSRIPEYEIGPAEGMLLSSQARRGQFYVLGFSGDDERAHADQLHSMGKTLLPLLRQRWSSEQPP